MAELSTDSFSIRQFPSYDSIPRPSRTPPPELPPRPATVERTSRTLSRLGPRRISDGALEANEGTLYKTLKRRAITHLDNLLATLPPGSPEEGRVSVAKGHITKNLLTRLKIEGITRELIQGTYYLVIEKKEGPDRLPYSVYYRLNQRVHELEIIIENISLETTRIERLEVDTNGARILYAINDEDVLKQGKRIRKSFKEKLDALIQTIPCGTPEARRISEAKTQIERWILLPLKEGTLITELPWTKIEQSPVDHNRPFSIWYRLIPQEERLEVVIASLEQLGSGSAKRVIECLEITDSARVFSRISCNNDDLRPYFSILMDKEISVISELAKAGVQHTPSSIIRKEVRGKDEYVMESGSFSLRTYLDILGCGTDTSVTNSFPKIYPQVAIYMLETLSEMHTRCDRAHLDFKPENVLISLYEAQCGPMCRICVIDFSSSEKSKKLMISPETTSGYIAPEIIDEIEKNNAYKTDTKADVWAFGVILFYLKCGYNPFINIQGRLRDLSIWKNAFLKKLREIRDLLLRSPNNEDQYIARLLDPDPIARPPAVKALKELEKIYRNRFLRINRQYI